MSQAYAVGCPANLMHCSMGDAFPAERTRVCSSQGSDAAGGGTWHARTHQIRAEHRPRHGDSRAGLTVVCRLGDTHRGCSHMCGGRPGEYRRRGDRNGRPDAGSSACLARVVGVLLLVVTFLLSFTGYLLPWDQLAFWAITVGSEIGGAAPIVGPQVNRLLLGDYQIGQSTLIRFYTLHVIFLPLVAAFLMAVHFWRIRKDGGISGPL